MPTARKPITAKGETSPASRTWTRVRVRARSRSRGRTLGLGRSVSSRPGARTALPS